MKLPRLFAGSRRRDFALLVVNGGVQAAGAVATALLVHAGFDRLIAGEGADGGGMGQSAWIVGILIGIAVVNAWLRYREHVDAERVGQSYVHALRMRLYRHLMRVGPGIAGKMSRGALTLRFVGDLTALRRWVSLGLARLLVGSVVIVTALAVLAAIEPTIALSVGTGVAMAGLLGLGLGARLQSATREVRRRRGRLAAALTDRLAHLHLVQVFGQERRETARFKTLSRRLKAAFLQRAGAIGLLRALADAGAATASLCALLVGAQLVALGVASPGAVVAAMLVAGLLAPRLQELGRIYEYWTAAHIAREKLHYLLRIRPPRAGALARGGLDLPQGRGALALRGIALDGLLPPLDLAIAPGERLCIVGENGAGKSSLLQVIAGLRRPDGGSVELNGQDLAVTDARQVRRAIGLVSCDLPLLRGSLRFNLTYGLGGPDKAAESALDEIVARCDLAGLLERLPQGLDTQLSEQQSRLSTGERLRIALARSLLLRPQVLLLDEMDAHLDGEGVAALDKVIREFEGSLVFVTHRRERTALATRTLTLRAGQPAVQTDGAAPLPLPLPHLKVVT
ncbi:ABC transporter ATP-binding protein [Pelagibius sp. 7325]|uniref:ABC transporter ATP-binding protein n=1 Tax=Pelagibius sp. 7325 TaxID=3131994 RepID=UPI0030EBB2F6